MKFKTDFVTNSSSTAFVITNTSDIRLTLVDFVRENPQLLEEFKRQYRWHTNNTRFTQEQMLKDAEQEDINFGPYEDVDCVFGDEAGTVIGNVFDYILRDGGSSENFKWHFDYYMR